MYEGLSFQLQRAVAGRRAGSPGLQSGAHLGRGFVSGGDTGLGSEPVTGPGLPGGELEFPGLRNVSEKPEHPLSREEPGREQGSTPPHRPAGAHLAPGPPSGVACGGLPGPWAAPPGRSVHLWLGGAGLLERKRHWVVTLGLLLSSACLESLFPP